MRMPIAILASSMLAATSGLAEDVLVPDVRYPILPRSALSREAFIPSGWKLESAVSGDLDGDGKDDLVMVLHQTDPNNILHDKERPGDTTFDSNPRILAVAFARPDRFDLALQNHIFIPRRTNPALDDPLDDGALTICSAALTISLRFFASSGTWVAWTKAYTFRYRNSRFELIGFDKNEVQRDSGKFSSTSLNFLTNKKKAMTGSIENDSEKAVVTSLQKGRLPSIDEIGSGIDYDPADANSPRRGSIR